jgi:hypothetical protein
MRRFIVLWFSGLMLFGQQLRAQEKVQRTIVEQDIRVPQVIVDSATRDLLSGSDREKVQASTVPVLLPRVATAFAALNLIMEKSFYSATWVVSGDARANVEGSRVSFKYPDLTLHVAGEHTQDAFIQRRRYAK